MVDNSVPTNQFHPYQPMDAKPQSENFETDTRRFAWDSTETRSNSSRFLNVRNGAMLLGGLAAIAIGATFMRKRRTGSRMESSWDHDETLRTACGCGVSGHHHHESTGASF